MSILVNKETRVLIQGITGTQASFHVKRSMDYGTQVVAGVTPGKGGTFHLDVPVFDTVNRSRLRKPEPMLRSCMFPPALSNQPSKSGGSRSGNDGLYCRRSAD